ncbi:hypothetical protein AMJ96_CH02755 [Rhizobium sp. N113]|nr:hypothetical protein AMJ96_CH02755 [Rhizobium sp. N113]
MTAYRAPLPLRLLRVLLLLPHQFHVFRAEGVWSSVRAQASLLSGAISSNACHYKGVASSNLPHAEARSPEGRASKHAAQRRFLHSSTADRPASSFEAILRIAPQNEALLSLGGAAVGPGGANRTHASGLHPLQPAAMTYLR